MSLEVRIYGRNGAPLEEHRKKSRDKFYIVGDKGNVAISKVFGFVIVRRKQMTTINDILIWFIDSEWKE